MLAPSLSFFTSLFVCVDRHRIQKLPLEPEEKKARVLVLIQTAWARLIAMHMITVLVAVSTRLSAAFVAANPTRDAEDPVHLAEDDLLNGNSTLFRVIFLYTRVYLCYLTIYYVSSRAGGKHVPGRLH